MGVSENSGTPKSSHLNRVFHYFHHPFWGTTIFGNTHIKSHMFLTTIVPFSPDFEKAAMILASLMAVDGKKQKSGENSPVEVGSKKKHYLQGLVVHPWWLFGISEPSTVLLYILDL